MARSTGRAEEVTWRGRWEQAMKLDVITKFEVKAEAFRIMTGHMAPGKDASPQSYPAPYEERSKLFAEWIKTHGECVDAMIKAVERVVPDDDG